MASSARIDELTKKFEENPRRYFAPLANEYRKAGNLDQAIFICQEYLPQQPGHMSGHIVYGQALFELSRFDEARAVFETALSLDPENLIALRHLGDIARQAGDLRGARSWYQRVLEADPRNEEIAQIMLTVLTTPHESQPAVPSGGAPLGNAAAPAPETNFESIAPQRSDAVELPVEKSEDGPGLAVEAERQPEAEPMHRSRGAIPDDELLDLEDFSVGNAPSSSLVTAPGEVPFHEQFTETGPAFDSVGHALESEDITIPGMEMERTGDGTRFEPEPSATAAVPETVDDRDEPPPLPPETFATDIALGLPDDGTQPSLSEAHDAPTLDGLESYSEPTFALSGAPETAPEIGFESFFATPDEAPAASRDVETSAAEKQAEPSWAPSIATPAEAREAFAAGDVVESAPPVEAGAQTEAAAASVEEEPEAFVTETMAELYLQQGHLEAALDIYQRLAEQRPGDERLRERILTVADAIFASSASAEVPPSDASDPYAGYGSDGSYRSDDVIGDATGLDGTDDDEALVGPTIREFLAGVLQPRSFNSGVGIFDRGPRSVSTAALDDVPFDGTVFADTAFDDTTFDDITFDDVAVDAAGFDQPIVDQTSAPAFDDSVFDTSAYGDAASLGEPAAHDTPAFDQAPAHGVPPVADVGPTDRTSVDGPSFEESPFEATTEEIDLAEFRSHLSSSVEPMKSTESIDEAFGADTIEWPPANAAVEPEPGLPQLPAVDELQAHGEVQRSNEPVDIAPPALSRPTPSSSETVTGSIDALFSGADASSIDSTAASTLAQAFASEVPETPPLQGIPAHRATDELSLDHVFKSNPVPRPEVEGEGFSFDQFFADEISEAAPKPGAEAASSSAQGTDDIAQFNNWLNGLKKT